MNILSAITCLWKFKCWQIRELFRLRFMLVMILAISAPTLALAQAPGNSPAQSYDFSDWDVLLKKCVAPGTIDGVRLNTVNYEKLKTDPAFSRLIEGLKSFSPARLKTHEDRLAFWINVYNVFAVKMVTDNYPLESIKDVGSLFKPVWKRNAGMVGGKEYTLHEIEHEILRKMGEPRIHVAIVCASVSCPDLATDVYKAERLSEQLDAQMKGFLANPGKGMRVDTGGKKVFLSKIFDWFENDFESRGGVLKFIRPYVSAKDGQAVGNFGLHISYMNYNWRVNGSSR